MKDEDKTYENETVINFKQAQTDDIINKLRNNIRDLLSMNTQYKTELADQIVKINKLEQEIKDLKQERSDYYNASQRFATSVRKFYRQV